jgi:hypothetical protein
VISPDDPAPMMQMSCVAASLFAPVCAWFMRAGRSPLLRSKSWISQRFCAHTNE